MESQTTLLGLLRKARDLVTTGQQDGVIAAISSLRQEASGPLRDLAYYAVLDTACQGEGDLSLSVLSTPDRQATTVELLDATIARLVQRLH